MQKISEVVGTKDFLNVRPTSPERELLIATLDRAVLDYYGSEPIVLREAGEWLFGESDPAMEFSFEWTCAYLEIEPTALRDRIRQLAIPRNVSQAHRWLRTKVQSRGKLTATAGLATCGSCQRDERRDGTSGH